MEKYLKEILVYCFSGDKKLKKYCNPKYIGLDDNVIIKNISNDIIDWLKIGAEIKYYHIENKIQGFLVHREGILISFALKEEFRKKYAKQFFDFIKDEVGWDFESILWTRNKRAINWMVRNGCKKNGYYDKEKKITIIIN